MKIILELDESVATAKITVPSSAPDGMLPQTRSGSVVESAPLSAGAYVSSDAEELSSTLSPQSKHSTTATSDSSILAKPHLDTFGLHSGNGHSEQSLNAGFATN